MSHVRMLSIYDHHGKNTKFKGLFASCPKYMKQLKSLDSQLKIQSSAGFFENSRETVPKKILFPSDFLKFLPRFEEIKLTFPFFQYSPQMNRIFQFKKYPVSMRRISLHNPNCRQTALTVSLEHLTGLRDLEIVLMPETNLDLAKSVYSLISKVPEELQVLKVNFDKELYINAEINAAIKRLVNLKKVKLQLSTERYLDNLQILDNLIECPLESLNLELHFRMDQDTLRVKELISKKQNTLKKIKLTLIKRTGVFESVFCLTELVKAIDSLPQLTNFNFLLRVSKPELASVVTFKNLFTKPIPLKKFQLISNELKFPKTEFLHLLGSLQGISPHLEKLRIDVGKFQPESETESDKLYEFIRSLVNIRMLKLDSLSVPQQDLSGVIGAVLSLRNLTDLTIGQFFEVPMRVLVWEIEKILGKYGLRKFETRIMLSYAQSSEKYPRLNLINLKRKNPYLLNYPSKFVPSLGLSEETW